MLNIVNEIEKILRKNENNRSIEILQIDYPNEIEKLEEALLNQMGENDLKFLKTEFPDKWKY